MGRDYHSTGVKLENGKLTLMTPHGIDDLVNLIIKPSPNFTDALTFVKKRVEEKKWIEKWPKLTISYKE